MTIQTLSQLFTVCRLSDLSGCPIYPVSTFRSRSSFLPWQQKQIFTFLSISVYILTVTVVIDFSSTRAFSHKSP